MITDDDDDDDDDDSVSQVASQPVQAAQQVAQSPISSDPPAVIADEAAENADDANVIADGNVDSDGKDPQQAALDQAATVNNSIDPTGSDAVVDDDEDDGKNLLIQMI